MACQGNRFNFCWNTDQRREGVAEEKLALEWENNWNESKTVQVENWKTRVVKELWGFWTWGLIVRTIISVIMTFKTKQF